MLWNMPGPDELRLISLSVGAIGTVIGFKNESAANMQETRNQLVRRRRGVVSRSSLRGVAAKP